MTRRLGFGRLVGREVERRAVTAAIDAAAGGRGRLLLVSGEPGIGKTALATAAAEEASSRGFVVVWARCWEGEAPPGWLWRQVLRGLGRTAAQAPWGHDEIPGPARVAAVVAEAIEATAADAPLLLILEDLHEADDDDGRVVSMLLDRLEQLPVLIVGTLTDSGVLSAEATPLLRAGRRGVVDQLRLEGLTTQEVALLLRQQGLTPSPRAAARICAAAAGNPLLVSLLAQTEPEDAGAERGAPPEELRLHVRRQVERLPEETRETLRVLAVLARTTTTRQLAAARGTSHELVRGALRPALREGLVEETGDVLRFRHLVVRASLYADLLPARRAELHGRIARALGTLAGDEPGRRAQIAHHAFHASLGEGPGAPPLAELVDAGRQAREAGDPAEAASLLVHAVDAAEAQGVPPAERGALLLDLAAATEAAQRPAEAEQHRQAAVALGRLGADPTLLARGVAASCRANLFLGATTSAQVRALEEALNALPAEPTPLRVVVAAHLAAALYWTPERRRGVELAGQSVSDARALGDPGCLAMALLARHSIARGSGHATERLALASEAAASADAARDDDLSVLARSASVVDLRELGAAAEEVRDATAQLRAFAVQHSHAAGRWAAETHDLVTALLAGDPAVAHERGLAVRRLIGEAPDRRYLTEFAEVMTTVAMPDGQRRALIDERGRGGPDALVWRARALLDAAQLGEDSEAELDAVLAALHGPARASAHWLLAAALTAEAVAVRGDARRARPLRTLLEPHGDTFVVDWRIGACRGHLRHHLGLLGLTGGDTAGAVRDLEAAERLHRAADLGAHVERTRTALRRARSQAEATARGALGLLVREGAFWSLRRTSGSINLPDIKGVRYLATLIGSPHEPLGALALLRLHAGGGAASGTLEEGLAVDAGGADAVLDATAKRAYRQRLDAIARELTVARSDEPRAAALRQEQAALHAALAVSVGLGGRDRRMPSDAERARVSVTKALRAAVERIRDADPELGAHLDASLRTGSRCVYAPTGPGLAARP